MAHLLLCLLYILLGSGTRLSAARLLLLSPMAGQGTSDFSALSPAYGWMIFFLCMQCVCAAVSHAAVSNDSGEPPQAALL